MSFFKWLFGIKDKPVVPQKKNPPESNVRVLTNPKKPSPVLSSSKQVEASSNTSDDLLMLNLAGTVYPSHSSEVVPNHEVSHNSSYDSSSHSSYDSGSSDSGSSSCDSGSCCGGCD